MANPPSPTRGDHLATHFLKEAERMQVHPDEVLDGLVELVTKLAEVRGVSAAAVCALLQSGAAENLGQPQIHAVSMVLCERVEEEGSTLSLRRLRDRITINALPLVPCPLSAHIRIEQVTQPVPVEMQVQSPSGLLAPSPEQVLEPDKSGVISMAFDLPFPIEEVGEYLVVLSSRGTPLASHRLIVHLKDGLKLV